MQRESLRAGEPRSRPQEDVALAIAEVLRVGGAGYFKAAGSLAAALCDRPGVSRSERALCRALLSLCHAALGDRAGARRFARAALRETARPAAAMSADALRDVRRARALAANASALIGDIVRARRAGQVQFLEADSESAWLLAAGCEGSSWQEAPGPVGRLAKFVDAAHRRFDQVCRRGGLTPTEVVVSALVTDGASVGEVAKRLGRSEHTVRAHLRRARGKQGVPVERALRLHAAPPAAR
jgi:ATP/maltotriose-dependent transcriptional regulator MalT